MPNVLHVTVENPDELLNAGAYGAGAVVQVQSSTLEAGPFADDGSVPIVAAVRAYTYYDTDGVASTWYRTRYENAAGAVASDWTDVFQTGETAGLLCSLYDVKQELGETTTARDEIILDKILQVSAAIEGYVGAWLAPRPTDPDSTTTLLFDVPVSTSSLLLEANSRRLGIRALTSLGLASTSQPEVSGTYTAATVADILLRPRPTADGPASHLVITDTSSSRFYRGFNTVKVVGSFGPAFVPYDIQGVAIRAATRRVIGKAGGGVAIAVGPEGTEFLLPDMSGADRLTLDRHRVMVAA